MLTPGLMPKFREPQIMKRIEDLIYHAKSEATSQVLGAYRDGLSDGADSERRRLIERLREFEKDSIVAKLVAELIERPGSGHEVREGQKGLHERVAQFSLGERVEVSQIMTTVKERDRLSDADCVQAPMLAYNAQCQIHGQPLADCANGRRGDCAPM